MSKEYYSTIGLEIHAELKTNTKMFCSCRNDPSAIEPNTNICPICMAHPGTLPVVNKKALEHVIRVGLALRGTIANFTEFDRKNYFYPDIPKGYQISQYKYPIVSGGELDGFKVTRVHLEEDTANSKHDRGDFSLVDFNRAGVPLMELVTEPHTFTNIDITARTAAKFAHEFQLLLWALEVSDANMEKGEMRVEANISLSDNSKVFGTKVEVKNLNSFKSVERAIKFELNRMMKLLEEDRKNDIVQETRGWEETKQQTFSQRSKESAQDYRYFPDPDLLKFNLSEVFNIEELKKALPELPSDKRVRYREEMGIKDEDIESFINDPDLSVWFEKVTQILIEKDKVKLASNYVTSDLVGLLNKSDNLKKPSPLHFADLINLLASKKITSRGAKDILNEMVITDASPEILSEQKGLVQKNDEEELKKIAIAIMAKYPDVIKDYKDGKTASLQFLIGQIMKETKGAANPEVAQKIFISLLT